MENECFDFINDYAKLEVLYHEGGIAIDPIMELNKRFTSCMKYRLVFGAECPDQIHTYVIAAFPKQDFLLNLITTYYFAHIRMNFFHYRCVSEIACTRWGS